jgi:hypothetical protein
MLGSCTCHVVHCQEGNGPTWSTCYGSTTKGPPDAVAVQSAAVAQFWELLHEFTQYSKIPLGAWRQLLPHDTPFLHFPNVARQLHVN